MNRKPVRVLVAASLAAVVVMFLAGCAVVPMYPASTSSFEGYSVISYSPAHPTGIVFLFHGTGGSANFATKLETVDMLDQLVAHGYGFVSTDSTDRDSKQWNTSSLSLTGNADLARLSRLYASLVADGTITNDTPIYAIGMSRGAGFTSVFAQAFKDAGYPVAAIAPSHGPIPFVVRNSGGLDVPALFALGANDTVVDNAQIVGQVEEVQQRGVTAAYFIEPETKLRVLRFRHVPGIDQTAADAIFATIVDAGLWDQSGQRLKSIDTVESALATLHYPASVSAEQKQMLADELGVVLAVHQYSATYANQTTEFFDAHR